MVLHRPFEPASGNRKSKIASKPFPGTIETASKDWSADLLDLFRAAKIKDGHAHRFRDTFAVELLLDRCPLPRVSKLLGHSNTKITERHYSPWVREFQEQAEADVQHSWA